MKRKMMLLNSLLFMGFGFLIWQNAEIQANERIPDKKCYCCKLKIKRVIKLIFPSATEIKILKTLEKCPQIPKPIPTLAGSQQYSSFHCEDHQCISEVSALKNGMPIGLAPTLTISCSTARLF